MSPVFNRAHFISIVFTIRSCYDYIILHFQNKLTNYEKSTKATGAAGSDRFCIL